MKHVLTPLLLTVLFATTLPAQTRIGLGPETILTTFTRPTLASGEGFANSFAAAGRDGHYLMAWSEFDDASYRRASLHTAAIDPTGAIIEGSRYVAPALRTMDPNAQYPAVAFDGERFLVAWIEGTAQPPRVVAMRFDRDGKPLDSVPQQISLTARHAYVAVAAGGGEFTVAYSFAPAGFSVVPAMSRIAADGTILERDRVLSGTASFWRDLESNGTTAFLISELASNSAGCLIEFCSPVTNRAFQRIGSPTNAARSMVFGSLLPYASPAGSGVATDGTRFLAVTWAPNTTISQSGSLIRGQLTDPSGAQFIREFLIAKDPQQQDRHTPGGRIDAVWNGSSYAIAYEQRSGTEVNLRLTFVSQIGMALTDPVELAASSQPERVPVILPLGDSRVLVLYERGNYVRPEIVSRQATLSLRTRAVR